MVNKRKADSSPNKTDVKKKKPSKDPIEKKPLKNTVKKKPSKNPVKSKSRGKLAQTSTRKIPESKLKAALELIENEEAWADKNISCAPGIHQEYRGEPITEQAYKVQYARTCVLRRDWKNLAKILATCNPSGSRANTYLFPIFAKYAAICLAYNDNDLFQKFVSSVLDCSMDTSDVLKKCTQYPS